MTQQENAPIPDASDRTGNRLQSVPICTVQQRQGRLIPRSIRYLVIYGAVILAYASSSVPAEPETAVATTCAGTPVAVSAREMDDRRLLCEAALEATRFFHRHGLIRRQPLLVNVHQDAEVGEGSIEIGRYDRTTGEVKLLSFSAYRRRYAKKQPFRSPVSRALYRSFGVHEIAHAIADENFRVSPVPWLTQEYIAAVAQFATMESALRSRILERYRLSAFDTPESMSSIYYQLDPSAFAVKSYLHFLRLEDPGRFLRDLLSGAILLGGDEDW